MSRGKYNNSPGKKRNKGKVSRSSFTAKMMRIYLDSAIRQAHALHPTHEKHRICKFANVSGHDKRQAPSSSFLLESARALHKGFMQIVRPARRKAQERSKMEVRLSKEKTTANVKTLERRASRRQRKRETKKTMTTRTSRKTETRRSSCKRALSGALAWGAQLAGISKLTATLKSTPTLHTVLTSQFCAVLSYEDYSHNASSN